MSKREYTCDICGLHFQSDWDDEEAVAEFERDYGEFDPELVAAICDDCYRKVKLWEATS